MISPALLVICVVVVVVGCVVVLWCRAASCPLELLALIVGSMVVVPVLLLLRLLRLWVVWVVRVWVWLKGLCY